MLERVGHRPRSAAQFRGAEGLGTITGANSVFVLTERETDRPCVRQHSMPVVGRSAWLRGPVLTATALADARGEKAGRLLTLPPDFALDRRTRLGLHISAR